MLPFVSVGATVLLIIPPTFLLYKKTSMLACLIVHHNMVSCVLPSVQVASLKSFPSESFAGSLATLYLSSSVSFSNDDDAILYVVHIICPCSDKSGHLSHSTRVSQSHIPAIPPQTGLSLVVQRHSFYTL